MSLDLEKLNELDATESDENAQAIVLELLLNKDYRCYSSSIHVGVPALTDRYLRLHARVPGIFHEEPAWTAIACGTWDDSAWIHRVAVFSNGAVYIQTPRASEEHRNIVLFVQNDTGDLWGYPNKYFSSADWTDHGTSDPHSAPGSSDIS